jgi:hypothetical protein
MDPTPIVAAILATKMRPGKTTAEVVEHACEIVRLCGLANEPAPEPEAKPKPAPEPAPALEKKAIEKR